MSDNLLFMGIDPGKAGAIAFITPDRSLLSVEMMPTLNGTIDTFGFKTLVEAHQENRTLALCMIEKAIVLPKQGSVSGFTMGNNYGRLIAILELMGIPLEEIRPLNWKKRMFGSVKYEKNQLKEVAVMRARQLFPELAPKLLKSKDGLSEALLIAETGRRQFYGEKHGLDSTTREDENEQDG